MERKEKKLDVYIKMECSWAPCILLAKSTNSMASLTQLLSPFEASFSCMSLKRFSTSLKHTRISFLAPTLAHPAILPWNASLILLSLLS